MRFAPPATPVGRVRRVVGAYANMIAGWIVSFGSGADDGWGLNLPRRERVLLVDFGSIGRPGKSWRQEFIAAHTAIAAPIATDIPANIKLRINL